MEANINTSEGRKAIALHIKNMCTASSPTKSRDIECWNMYNEFQDEKEFDYLRKYGDYELPARIRNVGKVRSKINNLVSQQSRRPFTFSVSAIDDFSLSEKKDFIFREWIKFIDDRTKERYYAVTLQIQLIDQQIQQLQENFQKASQQEGADPAQLQQMQSMMPLFMMQFQQLKDKAEREQRFSNTEITEKERYFKYSYRDLKEQYGQKLMQYLYKMMDIKDKSIRNFISQTVSGKQYYFVDYVPGSKFPDFYPLNEIKVYFPSIETVKWTQDGPWVNIEEHWSLSQVKKTFSLSETQLKELEESLSYQQADTALTPDHGLIFTDGVYSGTLENDPSQSVKVNRIWYKNDRDILIKKSVSTTRNRTFTHFLNGEKKVLSSKDYVYRSGKYVNRKTKESIPANEVEFLNEDKGEYLNKRYVTDRYRAVILNDKIVLDLGKDPIQPRSIADYTDVCLPVVGRTFSTIIDRPYSLLWSTRDLQKLYKIVHYHRELLLAISGTRGNVIDMSQKPTDMSRQEWEYHKKMGRLYIQTTDKFGRKINNSFNQWAAFDDTVTNSIQYLDMILESLDNEISDTIGMPRQRMGVTVPSDQVGTSRMSLEQSLLTTEILYYDHDKVLAKAMTQLLNLTTRYCLTKQQILEITDPNLGRDLVNIPSGLLDKADFEVEVANNSKDEQRMMELKQFAIKQNDKGLLPFEQFLSLWNEDSLIALTKKFEYFTEKAAEIQQMSAAQGKQDMIDVEKAKIEFQAQYDMMMEQERNKLEQAKLQLDAARVENEKNRDLMKQRNEDLKLEQERVLRSAEIESENNMEMAYLMNQDKHETTNEQLQALKLNIESMMNQLSLQLQHKGLVNTHVQTMKKLDIEDKKARQKVTEQIKN